MNPSDVRYRERWHTATYGSGIRKQDSRIVIPESIRRVEHSEPCFMCGAARECRHRILTKRLLHEDGRL